MSFRGSINNCPLSVMKRLLITARIRSADAAMMTDRLCRLTEADNPESQHYAYSLAAHDKNLIYFGVVFFTALLPWCCLAHLRPPY